MTITATLPFSIDLNALDPSRIELAHEYTVLEHLYSPLIEVNKKGELVPGLAREFRWEGSNAHLILRDNLKSSTGDRITADDVIFSLKRLMILNRTSHGKISAILCPEGNLKDIRQDCPRLTSIGNEVIFRLPEKVPFLFKLLASIDYAIIPKKAVNPQTLKIINFYNTTGPYNLVSIDDGQLSLEANTRHYFYSEKSPQKIRYIIPKRRSIELLREGAIDIITTDDTTSEPEELEQFAEQEGFNLHKTMLIETNLVAFTKEGLRKIPRERRFKIGYLIRKAFQPKIEVSSVLESTYQFFPLLGEGSLSHQELNELQKIYNDLDVKEETGEGITLSISPSRYEYIKQTLKTYLPKLNIIESGTYVNLYDDSGFGDLSIVRTDTGFLEEISLISYSIDYGFFGLDKTKNQKWLEEYMLESNKNVRLKKLKEIHLNSLLNAQIVPLYKASYVAISNKKWNIDFSQFYSNSKLWELKKND